MTVKEGTVVKREGKRPSIVVYVPTRPGPGAGTATTKEMAKAKKESNGVVRILQ